MNKFDLMFEWDLSAVEAAVLYHLRDAEGFASLKSVQKVCSRGAERSPSLVRTHVSRLRRKVDRHGITIKNVHGKGYALTPASLEILNEKLTQFPIQSHSFNQQQGV